jgi:hypothetical protein
MVDGHRIAIEALEKIDKKFTFLLEALHFGENVTVKVCLSVRFALSFSPHILSCPALPCSFLSCLSRLKC